MTVSYFRAKVLAPTPKYRTEKIFFLNCFLTFSSQKKQQQNINLYLPYFCMLQSSCLHHSSCVEYDRVFLKKTKI